MINYLERTLLTEEEETELPSYLSGTVRRIKTQPREKTTEEEQADAIPENGPSDTPLKAVDRDDRTPAVVWRVKRDSEQSNPINNGMETDANGENQPTKTGLEQDTEQNRGQMWTALKRASVQKTTERGAETRGAPSKKIPGKALGREEGTERMPNVENAKAVVQNAELFYRRAVALGNQATYQKPGAGVAVIDSRTQKHSVDPTELDRAVQRDARRYNSEFTLF